LRPRADLRPVVNRPFIVKLVGGKGFRVFLFPLIYRLDPVRASLPDIYISTLDIDIEPFESAENRLRPP
jgi:hypothetical protein